MSGEEIDEEVRDVESQSLAGTGASRRDDRGRRGRKGLVAAAANFSAALDSDREWYLLHLEFALRAARNPKFATLFRETRAEAARIMAAAISEALGEEGLSSALKSVDLARSVRALVHGFAPERILGERSGVDPLPGEIMRLVFRGATGYAPS